MTRAFSCNLLFYYLVDSYATHYDTLLKSSPKLFCCRRFIDDVLGNWHIRHPSYLECCPTSAQAWMHLGAPGKLTNIPTALTLWTSPSHSSPMPILSLTWIQRHLIFTCTYPHTPATHLKSFWALSWVSYTTSICSVWTHPSALLLPPAYPWTQTRHLLPLFHKGTRNATCSSSRQLLVMPPTILTTRFWELERES